MIPTLEQIRGMGLKKKPINEILSNGDTCTEAERMDEVNAILRMNATKLDCKVSDLQWRRDKDGHIHVRRKSGILLR